MGRQLAEGVGTVWVRPEDGGIEMVSFTEGDDIPKWAADQMGDHCFAQSEKSTDYAEMSRAQLEAELNDRGVVAGGTYDDLVAALEANDAGDGGEFDVDTATKPELEAEIDRRNEGREDDAKISKSGKKDDLIAALKADDNA